MPSFTFTTFTGNNSANILNGRVRHVAATDTYLIDNRIVGLGGNDQILATLVPVDIVGQTFFFGSTLEGGDGDDTIGGANGNDTITGGAHNDFVDGGLGADIMDGGSGIDILSLIDSDGTLTADLIVSFAAQAAAQTTLATGDKIRNFEVFHVTSGDGNDTLDLAGAGNAGDSRLFGFEGNDTLRVDAATQGAAGLSGDAGHDRIVADLSAATGAVTVNFTGGNGTITAPGLTASSIFGGLEHVEVTGGAFADTMTTSGYGPNILDGGGGVDTYGFSIGAPAPAVPLIIVYAAQAAGPTLLSLGDTISRFEIFQVQGGAGNDVLDLSGDAHAGGSSLEGHEGNDTLIVDALTQGAITMEGFDGEDWVVADLSAATAPVTLAGLPGGGVLTAPGLTVTAGLNGVDRFDVIGGAFADILQGGDGADILEGGGGGDQLLGGPGSDTASYAHGAVRVKVALDGSIAFEGDAAGDTFSSIQRLAGTRFSDVLIGDANGNVINGGSSNDTIRGKGGGDVLRGDLGSDNLGGGLGNDTFSWLDIDHGGDTIIDFANVPGNDDLLQFRGGEFGGLAAGALAANRFTSNTTGLATTADHRFVYETDTGILRFDSNGSGAGGVTVIATLTGLPALTVADFVII